MKRFCLQITRDFDIDIDACCSTSPSLYLQLLGKATVSDQCTTIGPVLTNPMITLPPGGLTTWRPEASDNYFNNNEPNGIDTFTVGEVWSYPNVDYQGDPQEYQPLNVQDLACPTWGLGKSTSADGTVVTTIGPPWLPLIVPPMNIFSLDPVWSAGCTGILSGFYGMTTFALFDPPTALTPAPLLLPTPPARSTPALAPADPTFVPAQAKPSTEAAKPASLPNDPAAPAKTGDPGKNTPTQLANPAGSANLPKNSVASSNKEGDPPSNPPSDPKAPSVDGDPPSSSASDSTPGGSQQSPTDPKVPIVPVPQPVGDPQTQAQGLGAIIYNAFGKSGPEPDGSSTILLPPQSVFAVGAQTFTANPTGFKVNGAAIAPGGTAQTVDGTAISLDNSGVLAIGSSTISLTDPSATPVLAVAGQTFTPNPSAFSIAGTIVSAGGPAVTVGGTAISLDQYGALAIGSTTISLATPPSNAFATKAFTVAGQTFTPNPSAFSIAGTTISADGPAVTIGGTIINLGQSGALKIGSSTINLPTASIDFPSKVYTVAGQTFTPNPSGFPIAGTTISAGGPAVTVDGTIISLGQSGALAIGSSTVDISTPPYTLGEAYTVAGQVFTPNPSAFAVAGTTISAGGPAATVDGTIISLGKSGALAIGSSTVDLSNPSYTSFGQAYTVAGQLFTPNPSAFSIAGTTISAGGPAATVGGTIISLEPSGTLIIGSSTIPLLPQITYASDVDVDGYDVVPHSSFAVVDGVTVSAAAPGVTVSGQVVSLEAGGATLDIGTGRFALPTPVAGANGSVNVQAFTGGQSKVLEVSLYLIWGVCGTLMLLMWH